MDFLRLLDVFGKVLDLHDVVLGYEWVNFLSLLVDESRVFKLSAQMQLQLDLQFIFKHSVNPLLQIVL